MTRTRAELPPLPARGIIPLERPITRGLPAIAPSSASSFGGDLAGGLGLKRGEQ